MGNVSLYWRKRIKPPKKLLYDKIFTDSNWEMFNNEQKNGREVLCFRKITLAAECVLWVGLCRRCWIGLGAERSLRSYYTTLGEISVMRGSAQEQW